MTFGNKIQVQVKMTLLGFMLRNSWTVIEEDFKSEYVDRWVPCYMDLGALLFND